MMKKIMLLLIIVLLSSVVLAVPYKQIFNPFTQKLDYVHTSNFSGENMTFDEEFVKNRTDANLTAAYSDDWTNVTITESQISDLQVYITNNTAGWILNFSNIFSIDWTNITILESQILDLVHTTDTNETTRFNALTDANCSTGNLVIGVQTNGTVLCAADVGNATWNETHANTLYAPNTTEGIIPLINDTNDWSINFSNIFSRSWDNVTINWTQNKNYPVACPANSAITTLEDSVTCTDVPSMATSLVNSTSWNNSGTNVFLANTDYDVGIGTTNPSEKLEVDGNMTVAESILAIENITANGYIEGQPITGGIGSGILWASAFDKNGNVNLTYTSPLNITYPDMIVRLQKTDGTIAVCNLTEDNVTVTDNQHSVYYLGDDCVVRSATFANYLLTNISPGGLTDIFNVMAHGNEVEVYSGAPLQGKYDVKTRKENFYMNNLRVAEGIDVTTDPFPNITVGSGKYVYLQDILDITQQNSTEVGMNHIYRSGGVWTEDNITGLNLTHCDDTTDLVVCSDNQYRRYVIFSMGQNGGLSDTSRSYMLPPLTTDTTWATISNCIDIESNPLSYTLPSFYTYIAVVHHIYCGKRDDVAWRDGFIDIREGAAGFGATPDLSGFLTIDGSRSLTDDWDVGGYTIHNAVFNGSLNASGNINMNTYSVVGATDFNGTGEVNIGKVNTGQGDNELYSMDQDVQQADSVTFATVDTGQGTNDLYDMNQNVNTTDAVIFATVNTGEGANELYAMDQNVQTTDNVTFASVNIAHEGDTSNYYLDGTDTLMNWSDGTLILKSTEANTIVQIGKNDALGSGTGTLRIQDDSGAYYTDFTQDDATMNIQPKTSAAFVVFNDDSENSFDFRIETANQTHTFFIDGPTDRIGINDSTPDATLSIEGTLDMNLGQIVAGGDSQLTTLDTGHGSNELYAMDQDVQSTDSPTFLNLTLTGDISANNVFSPSLGYFRVGYSEDFTFNGTWHNITWNESTGVITRGINYTVGCGDPNRCINITELGTYKIDYLMSFVYIHFNTDARVFGRVKVNDTEIPGSVWAHTVIIDNSQPAPVTVANTFMADLNPGDRITLQWTAYTPDGAPLRLNTSRRYGTTPSTATLSIDRRS